MNECTKRRYEVIAILCGSNENLDETKKQPVGYPKRLEAVGEGVRRERRVKWGQVKVDT